MSEELRIQRDLAQHHIDEVNSKEGGGRYVAQISDGYHTFDELYEFRKIYNAALFNEWARLWRIGEDDGVTFNVHKSWKHHDGEECFGGGWFIVSAMLPTGLISNHYKAEDWDLFKVPEVEKALFEFDGHTGEDVLERLKKIYSIMSEFEKYQRKEKAELRPVTEKDITSFKEHGIIPLKKGTGLSDDIFNHVSISDVDIRNGSPKIGDMIARNPKDHDDQWLVAEQYFKDNFEDIK